MIPDRYVKRFEERIQVDGDCWVWQGGCSGGGYGTFRAKLDENEESHPMGVHVFAYRLLVGEIPADKQIDHLCKNKKCCNPEHLELVSASENMLRRHGNYSGVVKVPRKRILSSTTTHCPKGHPYTGDNAMVDKVGLRRCRSCARERDRIRYAARKFGNNETL